MSEHFQQFIKGNFMNKKTFGLILSLTIFTALFFVSSRNIGQAQIMPANDIYMFGRIENDKRMSGFFGKNQQDFILGPPHTDRIN